MNDFRIQIETDRRTGEILAVYLKFRRGRVAETREQNDGSVFVDYDAKGRILGLELLSPCPAVTLSRLADDDEISQFVRRVVPRQMVAS